MNINLTLVKDGKSLSSKQRGSNHGTRPVVGNNIFEGDDDNNDHDGSDKGIGKDHHPNKGTTTATTTTTTAINKSILSMQRSIVNQSITSEQDAIRQRSQMIAATAATTTTTATDDPTLYDYDGVYDSFSRKGREDKKDVGDDNNDDNNKNNNNNSNAVMKKESRYVADLLQSATQRKRARDIAHERKIIHEQRVIEMEDANRNTNYHDKDQFITAAYKRKLQERQLWQAAQDEQEAKNEQQQQEELKSQGGMMVMASFYGNLHRNVAWGGVDGGGGGRDDMNNSIKGEDNVSKAELLGEQSEDHSMNVVDGFTKASPEDVEMLNRHMLTRSREQAVDAKQNPETLVKSQPPPRDNPALAARQDKRRIRQEKVAAARVRYFQRHNLPLPTE